MNRQALERWASALTNEVEWRRCAVDPVYFIENYCYIVQTIEDENGDTLEAGAELMQLRGPQKEILETWAGERFTISLKARQIGWSTLSAIWSLHSVLFGGRPRTIIFLSQTETKAQKLLQKVSFSYDRLPPWMRARASPLKQQNLKKMVFENGAEIESAPSKTDPARGSTAWAIILDEWAFFDDPENAWASVEAVADMGGRIHAISTANGSGNFFHKFYMDAANGTTDFVAMFYGWDSVPSRDEAWYRNKASKMPEWQLHQEYPHSVHVAFRKSGNPVFDPDRIELYLPEKPRVGVVKNSAAGVFFQETSFGHVKIFREQVPWARYAIGADVAFGLDYGDFSSAHVIRGPYFDAIGDFHPFEVVAVWHGHIDSDHFAIELAELGMYYNKAHLAVEANNSGQTTIHKLRDLEYPNLFHQRRAFAKSKKKTRYLGWWTSKASKPVMIDDLGEALRDGDLIIHDEPTFNELCSYVRGGKDGLDMHGSPYDDRVMSLAIAWQASRRFSPVYRDAAGANVHAMSFENAWQEMMKAEGYETSTVIGRKVGGPGKSRITTREYSWN